MAEINTKLSSSSSVWFYKDTDGIAGSTTFGTGSGDTHTFSGSLFTTGNQVIHGVGDTSWLGAPSPGVIANSFGANGFIAAEDMYIFTSGNLGIGSSNFISGQFAGFSLNNASSKPILFTGKAYFDTNIYNSLSGSLASSVTASAEHNFLALSSSGPTSVLLPPAEASLELTIEKVASTTIT